MTTIYAQISTIVYSQVVIYIIQLNELEQHSANKVGFQLHKI